MMFAPFVLLIQVICVFGRVPRLTDRNAGLRSGVNRNGLNATTKLLQKATSNMQKCLSLWRCNKKIKYFSIEGRDNNNWKGRIVSKLTSSPPSDFPAYSVVLLNDFVELSHIKCKPSRPNNKSFTINRYNPILIENFVVHFDIYQLSKRRFVINNSHAESYGSISFPINKRYPNSTYIFNLLSEFIDNYC
uniref:Uncharacterized protein n=1 Tax=Mesocestoides corti TaxID=53468 RepID=A0A5K3EZY0_MESCO